MSGTSIFFVMMIIFLAIRAMVDAARKSQTGNEERDPELRRDDLDPETRRRLYGDAEIPTATPRNVRTEGQWPEARPMPPPPQRRTAAPPTRPTPPRRSTQRPTEVTVEELENRPSLEERWDRNAEPPQRPAPQQRRTATPPQPQPQRQQRQLPPPPQRRAPAQQQAPQRRQQQAPQRAQPAAAQVPAYAQPTQPIEPAPKPAPRRKATRQESIASVLRNPEGAKAAILLHEILGPPVALRPPSSIFSDF